METKAELERRKKDRIAQAVRYEEEAEQLLRNSNVLVLLRGAFFFAMLFSGIVGWFLAGAGPIGFSLCGLCFVTLVGIVIYHERLQSKSLELNTRAEIQRQSVARMERDWELLPQWQVSPPDSLRAVAQDLDLFGASSLFRWLCRANTPSGVRTLRDWIVHPANPEEIVSRQSAVKMLRDENDLRDELAVRGHLLSFCLSDPDQFLQWLEGEGWYQGRQWLLIMARVISLLFIVVLIGFITAVVPREWTGIAAMVIVGINALLSVGLTGSMHDIFFRVTTPSGEMQLYRDLFELMQLLPSDKPRLAGLRDIVLDPETGAETRLRALHQIMALANVRRAGLFGAVYLILQVTVLWDFHVMGMLEGWRKKSKKNAREWFDALGELEALMSLAAAAHDHPDWSFPQVDIEATQLTAKQIGHPLLSPDSCVKNDVAVGPQGTLLLVTGSNMSGKSTLLRSLGLNAVLAHAGGVVCASEYRAPPLVVASSMRIVDSLDDGVSFFMAELKRLKEIVDQADSFRDPNGPVLLYLLDEILQGTNSAERRIAVARVAAHLVARRSIGAISTHDLELGNDPLLAKACQPVHFRETFSEQDGQRKMTFDYQMREGVAPTTNALALLELVGLRAE